MDYFKYERQCIGAQRSAELKEREAEKEVFRLWSEPAINEKGEIVSRVPPGPVSRLLMDPSEENAREYIKWNEKRLEAIDKAQAAVLRVEGERHPRKAALTMKEVKRIHFIFGPTCPYSVSQARMIERIARTIGYERITAYPVSGDPAAIADFVRKTGMKARLAGIAAAPEKNITAVPVTIIETIKGQLIRFDGYTEDFNIDGMQSIDQKSRNDVQGIQAGSS
ncbi:MAG: conjugal transfer protein TraF [Nitrospirae bacterium]|nr:conjugal transfer protein TraF [Nitrospirota bacterium]